MSRSWKRSLSVLPGVGISLLPKLSCPLCWPAYAGLLSSVVPNFDHIPVAAHGCLSGSCFVGTRIQSKEAARVRAIRTWSGFCTRHPPWQISVGIKACTLRCGGVLGNRVIVECVGHRVVIGAWCAEESIVKGALDRWQRKLKCSAQVVQPARKLSIWLSASLVLMNW